MHAHQPKKILVYIGSLLLVVATVAGVVYVYSQFSAVTTAVEVKRSNMQSELRTLATVVIRNGTDEAVNSYITTCSATELRRFEGLLSRLAVLDETDVSELEALYPSCGTFFSRQKLALVQRLEDMWYGYRTLLEIASTAGNDSAAEEATLWSELVAVESERAELFAELVAIQRSLIANQRTGTVTEQTDDEWLTAAAAVQTALGELSPRSQELLSELESYDIAS